MFVLLLPAKAASRAQEGEEGEEKLLAPCHWNRHRHEGSRKTSFWGTGCCRRFWHWRNLICLTLGSRCGSGASNSAEVLGIYSTPRVLNTASIHSFSTPSLIPTQTRTKKKTLMYHKRPPVSLNTLFSKEQRSKLLVPHGYLSRSTWLSSMASAPQPPAIPRSLPAVPRSWQFSAKDIK